MSDGKKRPSNGDSGEYSVDSVMRALGVLGVLAKSDGQMTLSDVSAAAKINTSTTFRLLWNLERAGYARKSESGYSLGHSVLNLVSAYQRQNALLARARTYLDRLRDETGETISLVVRDGNERVCLYTAESKQPVRRVVRIGTLGPLWRGSAGRMLLAYVKPDELETILHDLENAGSLRRQLKKIRTHGVSTSMRDTSPDLWSIAAPLRSASGDVMAAISCSGPMQRAVRDHMSRCEQLTVAVAAEWSAELGYAGAAIEGDE